MNMEIIIVAIRREISMYGQIMNVFKPIDIGIGKRSSKNEDYYQTCAGYFSNVEMIDIEKCTVADIVAAPVINEEKHSIPLLWEKYENRYFYITDNNYVFVNNPETLEQCQAAFSDIRSNEDIKTQQEINPKNKYSVSKISIDSQFGTLKKAVFGQDEPLKKLLARIHHYQKKLHSSKLTPEELAEYKPNILLIGTTGSGKTLMIKEMAKLFSIPYCIEDATMYSETSFKGGDVIDMLKHLYINSEEDLEKAQEGILFVDEFDKICQRKDTTTNTIGVQQGLLKILEGAKMYISKTSTSNIGEFYFDTSRLTVVLSGAFVGLEDIILKRSSPDGMDFSINNSAEEVLKVTTGDLESYGVISEMAGRISSTIVLNKPTKEDLKEAFLNSTYSPLRLAQKDFSEEHITIQLEKDFVNAFIDKVYSLDTGFRGLKQVFNELVDQELYELENGSKKVLVLNKEKLKVL